VTVHGLATFAWDAADAAGRRLAAVQLVRLRAARPLHALPSPIPELAAATRLHIHRRDRLGGILHEYRQAA
jgi:hypothetical protein